MPNIDMGSCPCCSGCEICLTPGRRFAIDFGAGGWTQMGYSGCDACDQIAGIFVVRFNTLVGNACCFNYTDPNFCPSDEIPGFLPYFQLYINLLIGVRPFGQPGVGLMQVRMGHYFSTHPYYTEDPAIPTGECIFGFGGGYLSFAQWDKTYSVNDVPCAGPHVLSKVHDTPFVPTERMNFWPCEGTMPNTITVSQL